MIPSLPGTPRLDGIARSAPLVALLAASALWLPTARAMTEAPPSPPLAMAWPRALALARRVDEAAIRHRIDPLLLHAIAHVESRHDVRAVSRAGARGLMQLMPGTARDLGLSWPGEWEDPDANLAAAAGLLKALQARYGNDLPLVLAAYNAGPGAVDRHGLRVPPYPETLRYVEEVLAAYRALLATAAALGR